MQRSSGNRRPFFVTIRNVHQSSAHIPQSHKMLRKFFPAFVLCLLANHNSITKMPRHFDNITPIYIPTPLIHLRQCEYSCNTTPLKPCIFAPCCSTQPKSVSRIPCARIPNVTWVQLCLRFQLIAKHRVDQHPAVTAVPETPRAPIKLSCAQTASVAKGIYRRSPRHYAMAKLSTQ